MILIHGLFSKNSSKHYFNISLQWLPSTLPPLVPACRNIPGCYGIHILSSTIYISNISSRRKLKIEWQPKITSLTPVCGFDCVVGPLWRFWQLYDLYLFIKTINHHVGWLAVCSKFWLVPTIIEPFVQLVDSTVGYDLWKRFSHERFLFLWIIKHVSCIALFSIFP